MTINTANFRTMAATTCINQFDRLFVTAGTGIEEEFTTERYRKRAVMVVALGTIVGLHFFVVRFMTIKTGRRVIVRVVTLITA